MNTKAWEAKAVILIVLIVITSLACHFLHVRWLWLLLLIPVGFWTRNALWDARADTTRLIDSVVKNSLNNLGCEPDAASLAFLATHPFLSARIWRMLGKGGRFSASGGPVDEKTTLACDTLLPYVRDKSFRERYPCAGALMQEERNSCGKKPSYPIFDGRRSFRFFYVR